MFFEIASLRGKSQNKIKKKEENSQIIFPKSSQLLMSNRTHEIFFSNFSKDATQTFSIIEVQKIKAILKFSFLFWDFFQSLLSLKQFHWDFFFTFFISLYLPEITSLKNEPITFENIFLSLVLSLCSRILFFHRTKSFDCSKVHFSGPINFSQKKKIFEKNSSLSNPKKI